MSDTFKFTFRYIFSYIELSKSLKFPVHFMSYHCEIAPLAKIYLFHQTSLGRVAIFSHPVLLFSLQSGAAGWVTGFVTCYLEVPLACLGCMAAVVQPNYACGTFRKNATVWGGRLSKRFCLHFSESSSCSAWAAWQLQFSPTACGTLRKHYKTFSSTCRPILYMVKYELICWNIGLIFQKSDGTHGRLIESWIADESNP